MKNTIIVASLLSMVAATSQAAITLTGTALTGMAANAPKNCLVLLIVDYTPANGILGIPGLSGDLGPNDTPEINVADASLDVGGMFAGDTILGRGAVTTGGAIPGGFTFDNVAAIQGSRFALAWFPTLTAADAAMPAGGAAFGLTSGTDWLLPAANTGQTYSYSASDASGAASFYRVTVAGAIATNDEFTTSSGATAVVVPETSAALLGALGALGLLRRRR